MNSEINIEIKSVIKTIYLRYELHLYIRISKAKVIEYIEFLSTFIPGKLRETLTRF